MAPNTNLKAVALFGVSPKDLELIVGTSNSKQSNASGESCNGQEQDVKTLSSKSKTTDATASSSLSAKAELIVTPAPSFDDHYLVKSTTQGGPTLTKARTTYDDALQKKLFTTSSRSESGIKNEQIIDSDRYWEDVADSDTLWHYHSVTALRMDARRDALARVLKRLDHKKSFEQEASSLSLFNASAIVKCLQDDAKNQNKKHQSQALSKDGQDETNFGYWDELVSTEDEVKPSHGRVASPEVEDSDLYWTMERECDNKDEDDDAIIINGQKQETALMKERRHAATLRVQEEIRLLSRLNEFRQQQDNNNGLFSVHHMIELEQQRSRCGSNNVTVLGGVPVGHYEVDGANYWDW